MCIILHVTTDQSRPSKELLSNCEQFNPHGVGIAFIDPSNPAQVRYAKFAKLNDDIIAFLQIVPVPYVIHFRFATSGDRSIAMSHPYPIESSVPIDVSGYAASVLFHNGVVSEYMELLLKHGDLHSFTHETFNDTSVIAHLVSIYGTRFCTWFSDKNQNRFAVCDSKDSTMCVTRYGIWHEITPGCFATKKLDDITPRFTRSSFTLYDWKTKQIKKIAKAQARAQMQPDTPAPATSAQTTSTPATPAREQEQEQVIHWSDTTSTYSDENCAMCDSEYNYDRGTGHDTSDGLWLCDDCKSFCTCDDCWDNKIESQEQKKDCDDEVESVSYDDYSTWYSARDSWY